MTDPAALECRGLTKRYGRIAALNSVDLSVRAGECVALFGRNGAGKSTLIHAAGSLLRSYEGDVSVFGENQRRARSGSRRAVGLVLHDTCLYLDLSAADNLRFFARLYGVADAETRVRELLSVVELDARAHHPVRELSRGMKQRLAIARALVHRPRLLLLDEPFTGLDEPSSQALASLLQAFVHDGGAVLLTTHDLERAFRAATRAVILERGRIGFDNTTGDTDVAAFRHAYWNVLFTGTTRGGAGSAPASKD